MNRTRRSKLNEALSDLAYVIEDLFYCAALARSAGDHAAAGRLAKLGEAVANERATIEIQTRKQALS